jgi:acetyl-CoA carboxylase biotin carboxyl carrier protein
MTEVKQLAELMVSYGLTRVEYERDGLRVALERGTRESAPAPLPAIVTSASDTAVGDDDTAALDGTVVRAPLVGIVYGSREPGEAPFVSVGQSVKTGDTLCVIEAMKTFSEIPAPRDGTVTRILFENGQLAEFGAPLITIG